jgi:hypothetical protein
MTGHHTLKAAGRPPADCEEVHALGGHVDRGQRASRLIRHDLCARLAPLDRYGPADFASVLVGGVLALAKKMLAIMASKASPATNLPS